MSDTQSELSIIGGRFSHDTLRKVLADREPGTILDAPCGTGVFTQFLLERGWDVHCADIDPGHMKLSDVPFTRVNLNRTDDLEIGPFDAVVCANGLHRLFNPAGAIRGFYRWLKPGGSLFITVNNYASIEKRIRFLFYGSITNTINESNYIQTIDDPEANVRHLLFYPQLANLLESAGFDIVDIQHSSRKMRHRVMMPIAWAIRLGTLFISPKSRRRSRISETTSSALLPGGKYVFIEAKKPHA